MSLVVPSETIILKIKEFVRGNGRIPLKREITYCKAARARFGTWNNAIKLAGFDPNPVKFANKHIAKDGHKCDSFAEKIIDDWLFARKIKHERSVPYPTNNKFTCDFVINDKWIEYFGLHGESKKYDRVNKRKLYVAKKSGINLIKLYPENIFPKKNLNLLLEKI